MKREQIQKLAEALAIGLSSINDELIGREFDLKFGDNGPTSCSIIERDIEELKEKKEKILSAAEIIDRYPTRKE